MEKEPEECEPVLLDSEDELFTIYTSGTTGEPVGVVHTQAGYLLYAVMLHKVPLMKLTGILGLPMLLLCNAYRRLIPIKAFAEVLGRGYILGLKFHQS